MWCYKTLPEEDADYDMDYSETDSQFEHTIHDEDVDFETEGIDNGAMEYSGGAESKESSVKSKVYQFEEVSIEKY